MNNNTYASRILFSLSALALAAACGSSKSEPRLGVGYDEGESQILVTYARELEEGETLHARLRRGGVDALDCGREALGIDRIDERRLMLGDLPTWRGPSVHADQFEGTYSTEWLEMAEPTAAMLEEALKGEYVIDVCLMSGATVVAGQAFDIKQALDRTGSNGKFDGDDPEERIASTTAYAEACVNDLGEIPFFEKLADGDYATYNCLDSTAIPTTVTKADGTVEKPETEVSKCDEAQYIYSLCEPNAVDGRTNGPRVARRKNDEGTSWVLLCRKAKTEEGSYNDIAMIGHNPYTGKTCYFQNALYSKTDGLHVPHPGDKVDSENSPQQSASLWNGIHGGVGSGIECAKCHSTDPFIHTPWIDGAKDENGDPIVPKMGVDDDMVLGYNDAPYSIVNRAGQGWTMPKQLVSPEAAACTRCHRIGDGRWTKSWNKRLVGEDTAWKNKTTDAHQAFEHTFWMPPGVDGLEESTWDESEYGKAMKFILACGQNPSSCLWAPVPDDPLGEAGELPTVDLEGRDLAVAALKVLGGDVDDASCPGGNCASRRCVECHSVSKNGLKRWRELTDDALNDCNLKDDVSDMSQEDAKSAVDCLRSEPSDDSSVFEAAKLGILTTGVQYTKFRRLFQTAYGDAWLKPYAALKARVGMPKGSHPKLSQKEYATLVKWFDSGLENLDDVLTDPPPPSTCTDSIDSVAMNAHIANMQFEGWGAINEDNGIRMYGCAPGAAPSTCLTAKKDMTSTWGNGQGKIRELTKLGFRTSFWTRSSADGRYVGNGGGTEGSTITDLSGNRDIGVDASYDPGFFPDNSGFMFQGATGGAGICAQSVLDSGAVVKFDEPQCISARGINLYQHVARGTNGGDYFIINSQFTSDSGHASSDPRAPFNAGSTMKFTPMTFDGSTYAPMSPTIVDSPFEGDSVLSPSGQLVVSRLAGPEGRGMGFVVRRVQSTKFGDNYSININQKLATVCLSGAKANFSFDERFMVTHTYENDAANIVLIDLQTGLRYTVTNMPAGTYAMFPHFRSDGWFYFLVSDGGEDRWVAASDAALQVAGQ